MSLLALASSCGDGEDPKRRQSEEPNSGDVSAAEPSDEPVQGGAGSGGRAADAASGAGDRFAGGASGGAECEEFGGDTSAPEAPDGETPGGELPGSEQPGGEETPGAKPPNEEPPTCEKPENTGARAGSGGAASEPVGKGGTATGGVSQATGGTSENPGTGGAAPAGYPKACSDLYDPELVPTFELEIAPTELSALQADCEQGLKVYRPALFRYGSESAEVMVRLKGNWSFRCDKLQFLISFNETDSNGRFHGLRKIVLDAPWYDPSLLAERLAFSFLSRAGSLASCVNNARLVLNGEYYGVYSNVERIDKEYLQRHFPKADADGNLYEGGIELKTNETENDTTRRDALMAATDAVAIDALADLDQAVKLWANLAMLPDPDSYWAGVEDNHYLYDHPARGFLWLPADMDMSMRQIPEGSSVETDPDVGLQPEFVNADPFRYQSPGWGREPILESVLSDTTWCNRFLEALENASANYDTTRMAGELDTWAAQIASAVAEDVKKPFTLQTHLDSVATLKEFLPARRAFVQSWLESATCPVSDW